MDGTFKIIRRPFQQLWPIHAFIHKGEEMKQVPLAFAFMTRRTEEDYVQILQALTDAAGIVAVQAAVMDFEKGAWNAVRRVFPGIQIKGCVFHWIQCLWRRVQAEGLQETYNKRQEVHAYIRRLMALPFLPSQHMEPSFNVLAAKANTEQLKKLVGYIRSTWFESAVYTTTSISVYRQTVRTNNDVEGWHRRINARANGQGLSFYVLVPFLKKEADFVSPQMRLVHDELYSRDTRKKYSAIQTKLQDMWEKYSTGDLTTSELLNRASKMYGEF